jgi:hypothetical protein
MSLPPLANLHLGVVTAGNNDAEAGASGANDYDSDVEHEHEPLDRRAYRKFPKLMPAPEVTQLTGLPREVVGLIVEQAAMAARPAGGIVSVETTDAALGMCQWMKSFCRAAKVQGLPCDDDWFRIALGAFSDFVPEENALPMGSGFRTWKDLFRALCNALVPIGNYPLATSVAREFLMYATGQQPTDTWMWNFGTSASQRQLDTLLRALIQTRVQQWPSIITHRRTDTYYRTALAAVQGQLAQIQGTLGQLATLSPAESPYGLDDSDCMAFMTMLLMRGANPHGWEHWNDLNVQLYAAIVQGMVRHLDWENGGEERIRQLLRDGADPSYQGNTMNAAGYRAPPSPGGVDGYPHVLVLAVYAKNVHLLNALLDAGATVVAHQDVLELLKALGRGTPRPGWWGNERFPVDVATTQRLLFHLLMPKLLRLEGEIRQLAYERIEDVYDDVTNEPFDGVPAWVEETWRTMTQWADANLPPE